jgi:hypothetical protein
MEVVEFGNEVGYGDVGSGVLPQLLDDFANGAAFA